ncbi:hypothetical protein SBADM41S_01410 [Streptomyces badius]
MSAANWGEHPCLETPLGGGIGARTPTGLRPGPPQSRYDDHAGLRAHRRRAAPPRPRPRDPHGRGDRELARRTRCRHCPRTRFAAGRRLGRPHRLWTAGPRRWGARARTPEGRRTRTTLAKIESLRATGGETSDVPVRFDLTVAPDRQPGVPRRVHPVRRSRQTCPTTNQAASSWSSTHRTSREAVEAGEAGPTPEMGETAPAWPASIRRPAPALTDKPPPGGFGPRLLTLLALLLGAAAVV